MQIEVKEKEKKAKDLMGEYIQDQFMKDRKKEKSIFELDEYKNNPLYLNFL